MSKKIISAMLAAVLMLSLALTGCGSKETKTVNIYSANYEEEIAIEQEWLQKKFPDYEITITYMSSGKLAAKLLAEKQDTDIDIALSLGSGYANQLKEAGLLKATETGLAYRPEFTDPDNKVIPNGVWAGAIVVNTDVLKKNGLEAPHSYKDLLDPSYKGHVVMAAPTSSATGYFFLLGILNLYGKDEGWSYFDKLRENIMLFSESGSQPVSMVESGEAAVALGIDYQAMALLSDSSPMEVIFADEGAPYDYDTALLIDRGKDVPGAVEDVYKAITSADGNKVFNNYNISVMDGEWSMEGYPDNFYLMDMTGISDSEVKTEVLNEWSERYE